MTTAPNRSRLLRFSEGELINHKYKVISAAGLNKAEALPAGLTRGRPAYAAPLGCGGSSVVFLAQQLLLDRAEGVRPLWRALKFYLLSPSLARQSGLPTTTATDTQNVLNEIKNLTAVQHANVLRVIDAGAWDCGGQAINYLVTEYIPGPTLREVIACRRTNRRSRRGEAVYRQLRADPALILRILAGVCTAVAHIHAQNLYHCDIAPKNIFIHAGDGCRPVLGDFTLGRQIGDWEGYDRILIGGAMRYAPPPVHRHFRRCEGPRDFAAYAAYWDMYGLAKTGLEMLDLVPGGAVLPWKNALIRYLGEALREDNAVSAARLHGRIAKLL